MDLVDIGLLLSVRSMVCLESASLILDSLHLGFLLFLRSLGGTDFASSIFGRSRLELTPLTSDAMHLGPFVLVQSMARFDPSLSVSDFFHLGLPMLARSLA